MSHRKDNDRNSQNKRKNEGGKGVCVIGRPFKVTYLQEPGESAQFPQNVRGASYAIE